MTAFTSRAEALIENLREYHEYLVSELARVESILAAAEPLDRDTTADYVAAVLAEDPLNPWSAQDMVAAISSRGWTTDSADPVNTVRAALARLVSSEKARRVVRGRFAGVRDALSDGAPS